MRECGFKRVLFLVHRGQLARQSRESYRMVFDDSVSMGLVAQGTVNTIVIMFSRQCRQ